MLESGLKRNQIPDTPMAKSTMTSILLLWLCVNRDKCREANTHDETHTNIRYTHTHTHAHTHTLDMPIAEAMIANSYVRHSNLCWDYTIQQLARLMN